MDLNSSINSYTNNRGSTPYSAKTDVIGSSSKKPNLENLPKDVLEMLKQGEYDTVMLKLKEMDKGNNDKDLNKLLKFFMEGFKFVIPKNTFSNEQDDIKNRSKPAPVDLSKTQDKKDRNKIAKEVVKIERSPSQVNDSKVMDSAKLLMKTMESYLQSLSNLAAAAMQKSKDAANSLLQLTARAATATLDATLNPLVRLVTPQALAVADKAKELLDDMKKRALEILDRAASSVAEQAKKLQDLAAPLKEWIVPSLEKFRELAEHSFKAAADAVKHVSHQVAEKATPIFAPIINIMAGIPLVMNQTGEWINQFSRKKAFGKSKDRFRKVGASFQRAAGWLGERSEEYYKKVEGIVSGIFFSFKVVGNWIYEAFIFKIFKFLYELLMKVVQLCQKLGKELLNVMRSVSRQVLNALNSLMTFLKAIPIFCYEVIIHTYRQAVRAGKWIFRKDINAKTQRRKEEKKMAEVSEA